MSLKLISKNKTSYKHDKLFIHKKSESLVFSEVSNYFDNDNDNDNDNDYDNDNDNDYDYDFYRRIVNLKINFKLVS